MKEKFLNYVEDWKLRWINIWSYKKSEIKFYERRPVKNSRNEIAQKEKDFSKKGVLWEGMHKLEGWDPVGEEV